MQKPQVIPVFIRVDEFAQLTGLSKSTIWKCSASDPSFPKPYKLTRNTSGWKRVEVMEWLNSRSKDARYSEFDR